MVENGVDCSIGDYDKRTVAMILLKLQITYNEFHLLSYILSVP